MQELNFNGKLHFLYSLSFTLQSALDVNVKRNYVKVSIVLVQNFIIINVITFAQSQEKTDAIFQGFL